MSNAEVLMRFWRARPPHRTRRGRTTRYKRQNELNSERLKRFQPLPGSTGIKPLRATLTGKRLLTRAVFDRPALKETR
jgi:hypothetical protein